MATNGLLNGQYPVLTPNSGAEFGDVHNTDAAQPTKNPAMAPGAVLSKRIRNYGDIVRHVKLVSRSTDGYGNGQWLVNDVTYSYANGNPIPGSAVVSGSTSTISEAQLNGAFVASSV